MENTKNHASENDKTQKTAPNDTPKDLQDDGFLNRHPDTDTELSNLIQEIDQKIERKLSTGSRKSRKSEGRSNCQKQLSTLTERTEKSNSVSQSPTFDRQKYENGGELTPISPLSNTRIITTKMSLTSLDDENTQPDQDLNNINVKFNHGAAPNYIQTPLTLLKNEETVAEVAAKPSSSTHASRKISNSTLPPTTPIPTPRQKSVKNSSPQLQPSSTKNTPKMKNQASNSYSTQPPPNLDIETTYQTSSARYNQPRAVPTPEFLRKNDEKPASKFQKQCIKSDEKALAMFNKRKLEADENIVESRGCRVMEGQNLRLKSEISHWLGV